MVRLVALAAFAVLIPCAAFALATIAGCPTRAPDDPPARLPFYGIYRYDEDTDLCFVTQPNILVNVPCTPAVLRKAGVTHPSPPPSRGQTP